MMRPSTDWLPFCTTDRQREYVNAVLEHGGIKSGARALGVCKQTLQDGLRTILTRMEKAAEEGYAPASGLEHPVAPGFKLKAYSHLTKTSDGEPIWLKAASDSSEEDHLKEYLSGLMEEIKPQKPRKTPQLSNEDLASAIIIGDAHFGMLAHASETLMEDFNIDIASADLRAAIDYLVDTSPRAQEGWLVNVGDFLHMDDKSNTTFENKNPLDVCINHGQLMRVCGAVIRYAINKMLTKFPVVRVVNAKGNHDWHSAFAINMFLEGVYEQEPRVIVEENDSKFNFIEWGQNLIGVNHGDRIKADRLIGVMTRTQAEAWGRTRYRRWWVGHIHHKRYFESELGCSVESFNTLAALDAWHAAMGYGAERGIEMITLHKEFGQVGRTNASLALIRSLQEASVAA